MAEEHPLPHPRARGCRGPEFEALVPSTHYRRRPSEETEKRPRMVGGDPVLPQGWKVLLLAYSDLLTRKEG